MSGSNRNGGWITVTRRRKRTVAKTPSSSNRRAQTAKNQKQFFPNWFDEAYPDELVMLGSVDVEAMPKRRPRPLDAADKVKVQNALVNLFRNGYHKIHGFAPDEAILEFLNTFLRRHRICISGGFILKSIGAFAEGTASTSIDVDIYIPSSPNVKEIHKTLQDLFAVDRKSDGKPKAKHFKVQTGSRSTKGSFFAKNGIYSVTKYERTRPGRPVIRGGGSSEKNSSSSSSEGPDAQDLWALEIGRGTLVGAMRALEAGANPRAPINGKHPIEFLLESDYPAKTLLKFLLEKSTVLPPYLTVIIAKKLRYISEDHAIALLQLALEHQADINAQTEDNETALDTALHMDKPKFVRFLLKHGAHATLPSSGDVSMTIEEAARDGNYPSDATEVLMAHLEGANSSSNSNAAGNTFYKAFKATVTRRRRHIAQAIQEFDANGLICSSEGSYQHKGECWNDAVHMLFFYADGLKEHTQPLILKGNIRSMVAPLKDGTSEGEAHAKRMTVYLDATRNRFARQVLNQTLTDELCASDMGAAIEEGYGFYRARGTNALVAAVMGAPKRNADGTNRPFHIGAADYVVGYNPRYIVEDLLKVFNTSSIVTLTNTEINYVNEYPAIPMPIDTIAGMVLTVKSGKETVQHATCFYTCNGVDYYFDDNFGVFQYPWRKLLAMPNAKLVLLSYTNEQDPNRDVNNHWPAVYIQGTKKLIVPMMGPYANNILLNWDGTYDKTKVWDYKPSKITYAANSYVRAVTIISFVGPRPAVPKKAPGVVGRGFYRGAYIATPSSSEDNALSGDRWLAQDEIPQNKSEMDIVQAATKSSPVQIIRSFDLTFCQNWYDGDELWSMDREAVYKRSPGTLEDSYVPIYMSGNPVTRKRILKYIKRGFRVQYTDPTTGAPTEITQANVNSP
jgi:hypothetical protein